MKGFTICLALVPDMIKAKLKNQSNLHLAMMKK